MVPYLVFAAPTLSTQFPAANSHMCVWASAGKFLPHPAGSWWTFDRVPLNIRPIKAAAWQHPLPLECHSQCNSYSLHLDWCKQDLNGEIKMAAVEALITFTLPDHPSPTVFQAKFINCNEAKNYKQDSTICPQIHFFSSVTLALHVGFHKFKPILP